MLEALASLVFAAACMGGIASCFVATINLYRTVANRKDGVPLFQNWWDAPTNIIYYPHLLTERGLAARRKCFRGVGGFLLCCAIAAGAGVLAGAECQ